MSDKAALNRHLRFLALPVLLLPMTASQGCQSTASGRAAAKKFTGRMHRLGESLFALKGRTPPSKTVTSAISDLGRFDARGLRDLLELSRAAAGGLSFRANRTSVLLASLTQASVTELRRIRNLAAESGFLKYYRTDNRLAWRRSGMRYVAESLHPQRPVTAGRGGGVARHDPFDEPPELTWVERVLGGF